MRYVHAFGIDANQAKGAGEEQSGAGRKENDQSTRARFHGGSILIIFASSTGKDRLEQIIAESAFKSNDYYKQSSG